MVHNKNSLTKEQRQELEEQFRNCPDCTEEVKEQGQIWHLMSTLEEEELPQGFRHRLRSRLHEAIDETQTREQAGNQMKKETQSPKRRTIRHSTLIKWGAGLVAVLALVLTIHAMQPFGRPNNTRNDNDLKLAESLYEGSLHYDRLSPDQGEPGTAPNEEAPITPPETTPWISVGEGYGETEDDTTATLSLYITNDWELEEKAGEVVKIAESLQMVVLEQQADKVVVEASEGGVDQVTSLLARISNLGMVDSGNLKQSSNTVTIHIEVLDQ